ncbi:uncharacterized protein ACMZJ9_002624, partial [Mantella aurantiaca]
CLLFPGLLCLLIISVSSAALYVQRGSDITVCNMKCPDDDNEVTLELYRQCGGKEKTLLENHCYYNHTKSHDPRLQLHTGSGCWKLTPARKDDTCVYKVWCHCNLQGQISSKDIRILDPVLISNITSNFSRLGQDTAVRVQFSGEESHVTWEVDGLPLPERYRLIDDNRTLIIPSVQRDDAERRFRVRITNPVSEEIRGYRLEMGDSSLNGRSAVYILVAAVVVASAVISAGMTVFFVYQNQDVQSKEIPENEPLSVMEDGSEPTIQNGFKASSDNGFLSEERRYFQQGDWIPLRVSLLCCIEESCAMKQREKTDVTSERGERREKPRREKDVQSERPRKGVQSERPRTDEQRENISSKWQRSSSSMGLLLP